MPVGDWEYHRDSLCDYSLSVMGNRSSGDDCERWQMNWNELVKDYGFACYHVGIVNGEAGERAIVIRDGAKSALLSAILEVEKERDNLKTVLHGNQDADYDKQLQIETLKAQLAEAEADAEHLADAITWLEEKTDPCKLALELHRARKEGK